MNSFKKSSKDSFENFSMFFFQVLFPELLQELGPINCPGILQEFRHGSFPKIITDYFNNFIEDCFNNSPKSSSITALRIPSRLSTGIVPKIPSKILQKVSLWGKNSFKNFYGDFFKYSPTDSTNNSPNCQILQKFFEEFLPWILLGSPPGIYLGIPEGVLLDVFPGIPPNIKQTKFQVIFQGFIDVCHQ